MTDMIRQNLRHWVKTNDSAIMIGSDQELLDIINSFGYEFRNLSEAHDELCLVD